MTSHLFTLALHTETLCTHLGNERCYFKCVSAIFIIMYVLYKTFTFIPHCIRNLNIITVFNIVDI